MLRIVDPLEPRHLPEDIFRNLFHFTLREAQLATMLLSHHSVETAAHSLGISLPTARTYIRNIFEKTSTSRQIDLVNLLTKMI